MATIEVINLLTRVSAPSISVPFSQVIRQSRSPTAKSRLCVWTPPPDPFIARTLSEDSLSNSTNEDLNGNFTEMDVLNATQVVASLIQIFVDTNSLIEAIQTINKKLNEQVKAVVKTVSFFLRREKEI